MLKQTKELFDENPDDLDRFIFASQAFQAEAKKFWIEYYRTGRPHRTGILWWNLREGWPIISDAVVDYYGGKKLAYYYIKRVQTDACVMITDTPANDQHPLIAVNDTRAEKQGTVTVKDLDTKKILFTGKFTIPPNGKTTIAQIPSPAKQAMWLIEYTIGTEKFTNHYLAGTPPFKLKDYEKWYPQLGIDRN